MRVIIFSLCFNVKSFLLLYEQGIVSTFIFVRSIGLRDLNASKDAAAFWLKVDSGTETSNLLILDPFTRISDSY